MIEYTEADNLEIGWSEVAEGFNWLYFGIDEVEGSEEIETEILNFFKDSSPISPIFIINNAVQTWRKLVSHEFSSSDSREFSGRSKLTRIKKILHMVGNFLY